MNYLIAIDQGTTSTRAIVFYGKLAPRRISAVRLPFGGFVPDYAVASASSA
jgi:glycerol kinase